MSSQGLLKNKQASTRSLLRETTLSSIINFCTESCTAIYMYNISLKMSSRTLERPLNQQWLHRNLHRKHFTIKVMHNTKCLLVGLHTAHDCFRLFEVSELIP